MKLATNFECGGGKRLKQLAESHWRVEASGDASGYNKYVCVQVTSDAGDSPATLRLELHPDSDLGEAGEQFFLSHFPSNIWYCSGEWEHWIPIRNTWEDSVAFEERHITLRVPVGPGRRLTIATNPPLRYSDLMAWVDALRALHPDQLTATSLGGTPEGRDIPVLRLARSGAGRPRLLVLAGQHPSEHCGNWACQGIVEHCLSAIAEARAVAGRFDVAVVPMINPDGNVRGLSGANAEGVNLVSDFGGAAEGRAPRATENRLLWDWLCAEFPPDVILHFHGYMGWRAFAEPPYDGTYVLRDAERLYSDPQRLAAYRAIQDHLCFETPAHTARRGANLLGETTIEHQLAIRFGTLSAFYEINAGAVGAFEQFRRGPQVLAAIARALPHGMGKSDGE